MGLLSTNFIQKSKKIEKDKKVKNIMSGQDTSAVARTLLGGVRTLPGEARTLPGGARTLPGAARTLPGGASILPGGVQDTSGRRPGHFR